MVTEFLAQLNLVSRLMGLSLEANLGMYQIKSPFLFLELQEFEKS